MKKTVLSVVVALLVMSLGQAQWKKIKGNGKSVTIERSVGDYEQVALAGWFDVKLVSGEEGELTIKGEENLIPYIKTEVNDGRLVIKQKRGISLKPSNWSRRITITVPVEEINGVSLSGSGDIVSETTLKADYFKTVISGSGDVALEIQAQRVKASMSGSGDMELSGKTTDLEISVSGSGDISAYDLEADFVEAQVYGSADIQITANELIKARVSGSGDISYKGNPKKIDTKSSGSGDVSSY
ncbi:MAG: head GIN domain-containing protein [Bacteroidota bacterium]